MEYRAIKSDEVPQWRAFEEYCFRLSAAEFDPWMANTFRLENARGVFSEEGDLLAAMTLFPFALHMDGARMAMGGIGGVASVPENRRGGHVGRLITRSIAEMKEREMPLSALYPFKQAFYRRYGWDVAAAWLEHKIPTEALSRFRKAGGVVKRYLPGQAPLDQLRAVYSAWAASRRGCMVRESDWHWNAFLTGGHHRRPCYVAIWYPQQGAAAEGYLLYRFEEDRLTVRELVTITEQAEQALLGFIANHDSQSKHVILRTARDYPLWHLVENTYEVESKLSSGWQLRLVDVQAAFESRPWPETVSGRLNFRVADEYAAWNHGTWQVAFEAGRAEVRRVSGVNADLAADVQTWAQLYAGFIRPDAALKSGRLEAVSQAALHLLGQAMSGPEMDFIEFF